MVTYSICPLTYSIKHKTLQVHPCWDTWQTFLLLYSVIGFKYNFFLFKFSCLSGFYVYISRDFSYVFSMLFFQYFPFFYFFWMISRRKEKVLKLFSHSLLLMWTNSRVSPGIWKKCFKRKLKAKRKIKVALRKQKQSEAKLKTKPQKGIRKCHIYEILSGCYM